MSDVNKVFCNKCGKEVVLDDENCFCPKCGAKLSIVTQEDCEEIVKNEDLPHIDCEKSKYLREPKRNKKIIRICFIIAIIIILITLPKMITGLSDPNSYKYDEAIGFVKNNLMLLGLLVVVPLAILEYTFQSDLSEYRISIYDPEKYKEIVKNKNKKQAIYNEQQKKAALKKSGGVCPKCGSKNTVRISKTKRSASVITVGLASAAIGKQYKCKNCNHLY